MKFLEKVKNMFTEEVEEEIKPIQTEVRKVEIAAPKVTPVKEPVITENPSEEPKKDEKFRFPVYFDDKDFDELEAAEQKKEIPKKIEPEVPKVQKKPVKKEAYGGKNPAFAATSIKEEKKTFKPTPIISPVYGILDKNYKKDDITPKKRVTEFKSSKVLTVDDIRNKAFGTLEDELENNLFGKTELPKKEKEEDTLDLFDELDFNLEEPKHGKEEIPSRVEKNKELELMDEVDDLGQMVINERPEESNMIEEEMDKICSEPEEDMDLTESDLFNLIDSMYEKKDGEE